MLISIHILFIQGGISWVTEIHVKEYLTQGWQIIFPIYPYPPWWLKILEGFWIQVLFGSDPLGKSDSDPRIFKDRAGSTLDLTLDYPPRTPTTNLNALVMQTMQLFFVLRFCHLKSVQNLCANACDHGIVFLASIPCISVRAVSVAWEGGVESWTIGRVSTVQATKHPGSLPLVPGRRHQALLQHALFNLQGIIVTYYVSIILCPLYDYNCTYLYYENRIRLLGLKEYTCSAINHGTYIRW